MEMVKLTLMSMIAAVSAMAGDFAIGIGNPIAANLPAMKGAILAVRLESCDATKFEIAGTAEGIFNGERRSVPLKFTAASVPKAYVVGPNLPEQGKWVLNLNATCGDAKAGAIVPLGPRGFIRESSKFFSRPPANAEVEAALKALAGDGK